MKNIKGNVLDEILQKQLHLENKIKVKIQICFIIHVK